LQFLLNQLHLTNKGTEQKTEDCSCIIHRSFYGRLQSDVTCEACRNVTTVYDPVMDLSLDLRIKDKKLAIPGNDGTVQTVEQCLSRFTATERLGINEYNCSKCSGPREATKQLTINRLPPVLCIQLKVL
jgi:ubiquitin carboxyl-terminal hydrolase 22/27/51